MNAAAIAKPSATVILARPGRQAPELLMVRRDTRSSFGGAFVFPGGVIDDDDPAAVAEGPLQARDADRILGLESGGLAYFSAAVRELFEETGVFLGEPAIDRADEARQALLEGRLSWRSLVAGRRLFLDRLHYVSFWITPESLPKRYSTRFFVAPGPDGACATPCGREVHECRWLSAEDALDAGRRGDIKLHFPTRLTLETLAEYKSLDALLDWSKRCASAGVPCIFPSLPERDAVESAASAAAAERKR